MGIETGTALLIGSAISATTAVAGGMISASATRQAAATAAAEQQRAANAQAEAMQVNANRKMYDLANMKNRASIEKNELERKNRILSAKRANQAAGSGFTVSGTSLERLLVSQDEQDRKQESVLGWEWDTRINYLTDEINLDLYQADVVQETGQAMAASTISTGNTKASSYISGGIVQGLGTLGSGAVKAAAEW